MQPVSLKYGKLTIKYPWIYTYFTVWCGVNRKVNNKVVADIILHSFPVHCWPPMSQFEYTLQCQMCVTPCVTEVTPYLRCLRHYWKTWPYPQNRNYIMYCNTSWGGPTTTTMWFLRYRICRQKDAQTQRLTCSSQYFAFLLWRSNKEWKNSLTAFILQYSITYEQNCRYSFAII